MRKSILLAGIGHVAAVLVLAGVTPAAAQFQPSNTATISGTVGAQTLAGASGTVNVGGAIRELARFV